MDLLNFTPSDAHPTRNAGHSAPHDQSNCSLYAMYPHSGRNGLSNTWRPTALNQLSRYDLPTLQRMSWADRSTAQRGQLRSGRLPHQFDQAGISCCVLQGIHHRGQWPDLRLCQHILSHFDSLSIRLENQPVRSQAISAVLQDSATEECA